MTWISAQAPEILFQARDTALWRVAGFFSFSRKIRLSLWLTVKASIRLRKGGKVYDNEAETKDRNLAR